MKFFLFLFFYSVSSPLFASQINFEHIFSEDLVPKDSVELRRWSNDPDIYLDHDENSDGFTIAFTKVSQQGTEKLRRIESRDLLSAFKELSGFSELKWKELKQYQIGPKEGVLLFYLANDYFYCSLKSQSDEIKISRLTHTPHAKHGASFSPDEKFLSYIENDNIWILDISTQNSRQVTFEGDASHLFGKLDWVYQEEIYGRGNFKGYWWSPDSQTLAFLKTDESPVSSFPIVDHMDLYGNLSYTSYPKPGKPNPKVSIGIVNARGGEIKWLDLSKYDLMQYLVVGIGFTPDSQNVVFQIQDRIQSWLDLNYYHIASGEMTTVVKESSIDWVNRLQNEPVWHDKGFYWLSQRSGYTHLYSYHLDENLKVKDILCLSEGEWDIKRILHADRENIYFDSNHHSLLENHIYRLNLATKKLQRLSFEAWNHSASFNKDGTFLVLSSDSVTKPKRHVLYSNSEKGFMKVEDLFIPETGKLEALQLPEPSFLSIPARDGFILNAMLIKPKNFDPEQKYPVISYNYSGPSASSVANRFGGRNYLWHQYLASKGYVIWICDNRSASGKGHLSEASSYRRLGVQELKDLEDGLAYLKEFNWIDSEKIGIWGWSFGGYMTAFALTHSTNFKLGIAVAPVVDWKLYDSIYTERYMDTPQENPAGYKCSSVLECAKNLRGKFFLIHGTMDDNVHYQNAVQLSYALQKENIDFDQMFYANSKHGMNKIVYPHLYRQMEKFIETHL